MGRTWNQSLDSVRNGCGKDGWDSYGALAVTEAAIRAASHICESLSLAPTNNGGIEVCLADEAISVTVNSVGEVTGVCVDTEDAASFLRKADS